MTDYFNTHEMTKLCLIVEEDNIEMKKKEQQIRNSSSEMHSMTELSMNKCQRNSELFCNLNQNP